jgi:hypothetical protein
MKEERVKSLFTNFRLAKGYILLLSGKRRMNRSTYRTVYMVICLMQCIWPSSAVARDVLRIATWNVEMSRKGPGLLSRDIVKGEDPAVLSVVAHLGQVSPDVVLLTGFDTDVDGVTLNLFAQALADAGHIYPHRFTRVGNAGLPTRLDLDKDGRLGEPEDAQSYGAFRGQGGMGILSRVPLLNERVVDFSEMLWKDIPSARLPRDFWSDAEFEILRLSSHNHWDVPVIWNGAVVHLFAFHAAAPVFDGAEDRNGKRNADESALWLQYLDGALNAPAPQGAFVLLGDANLDPLDGEGVHAQIQSLLKDPRLQDPKPRSDHGLRIANEAHLGDPGLDTVDWSDPSPGNLRVDYVLPSAGLTVVGAGVAWPDPIVGGEGSRHGLVWVDIAQFP